MLVVVFQDGDVNDMFEGLIYEACSYLTSIPSSLKHTQGGLFIYMYVMYVEILINTKNVIVFFPF